ncbi:hypothetical protein ACA910_018759 [Epithemia clementina (nom. ined.)]
MKLFLDSSPSLQKAVVWCKLVVLLWHPGTAWGRSWKDIEILHGLSPPLSVQNLLKIEALKTEVDPLMQQQQQGQQEEQQTQAPESAPVVSTTSPTVSSANMQTAAPTTWPPTMQPRNMPSPSPTADRSQAPSSLAPTSPQPSNDPSQMPTEEPDRYPFNEPPIFPEPWYFNYDTRPGARYGPGYATLVKSDSVFSTEFENNKWADETNGVDIAADPDFYWKEFSTDADGGSGPWKGVLANRRPSRNQCGNVGLQSPINVRHNGLGECEETHEIRSKPGDFRLSDNDVQKEIHANKLRLLWKRRPCSNLNLVACQEPDPPMADFPNGWGGYADAMHADFKVPSEHLLNGVRYDAEFQVFHLHKDRRRMPTTATLIRATDDGFNWYFDEALQAFQFEFHRDELLCAAKQRRERKLVQDFYTHVIDDQPMAVNYANSTSDEISDYRNWAKYSIASDEPGYIEDLKTERRRLQSGVWDPHHPMLEPSIHFYRYEGSLTEPPCGEWVSWFVTDIPMTISTDQLEQLKYILFNHVDRDCRRTSVHYEQSVARPIQETTNRPVTLCTSSDFGPDPQ